MASQLLSMSAGAAMCGMIYYAMANDMRSRTDRLASSLSYTSLQLSDPSILNPSPFQAILPASERIVSSSLSSEIKARWNQDFETLFHAVRTTDWRTVPREAVEGVKEVAGLASELGKRLTGGEKER